MTLRSSLLPSLLVGTLLLLASPAPAIDGEIEINQARARRRSVTPSDASGFPVARDTRGSYRLTSVLAVPTPDDTAIDVAGALVHIDLSGFAIQTGAHAIELKAASRVEGVLEDDEFGSPIRADSWRREFGIAFQAGLPQGDFVGDTSFGAAFFGGLGLPNLPVVLGADFSFLIGGGDRKTLEESDFSSVIADTSSDITMLHFVARLQPASGRFRPFLDAVIGFKHFETRTRINEHWKNFGTPDDCVFTNCTLAVDNEKNSSDAAFSYGVGAGLDMRIYTGNSFLVSVLVGARYLFGQKAEYVIPSSIRIIDEDTVEFETAHTRTDLLTTQLGFSVLF
jgi:opacity protein-like surface antigen